jgi:hypothetical protein
MRWISLRPRVSIAFSAESSRDTTYSRCVGSSASIPVTQMAPGP